MKATAMRPPSWTVGGTVSVKPLAAVLADDAEADKLAAEAVQAARDRKSSLETELSALVRRHWGVAKDARQQVERDMLAAVRAKRGEYDPQKLAKIRDQGGSEIYMMLFATKARQAKALLGDVLIGTSTEKPWTIRPTPKPDLPPQRVQQIVQAIQQQVAQMELAGQPPGVGEIRDAMLDARDRTMAQLAEEARRYAARAEVAMEDRMVEGGWLEALDQFIDDMTVFKTAFIKGPVVRRVPRLSWVAGDDGAASPQVDEEIQLQWERVDPFNIYPAPWSRSVDDAFLIERHRLSRTDLEALIGVKGYSEGAIREALDLFDDGGLHEWLALDSERTHAEGRTDTAVQDDLIDTLQYWGSVSGKMLRGWGMTAADIPDEAKQYQVECWLVGHLVIKAVLNPDPLARRPYYADGYARVPGAFWHNSLYDLIRDCQDMCNASARALANNLGVSSGPQVVVNVQRLPKDENIEEMYPWKIWQVTSDPLGSTAKAIDFFQPNSNASELMGVYDKFSVMADEYSGIPRYMAGVESAGGAGRTASGLSMMIGNASKTIKQIVSSIDMHVIGPSVSRLYEWMMRYDKDAGIKGDLNIVARGAMSLVAKEAAQIRRNEFLQATANPVDMQIIGVEGRANLLRSAARMLDMDTDAIVPPEAVIRARMAQAQQQQQQQQQQQPRPGGEQLQNGAPVTDHFSPQPSQ